MDNNGYLLRAEEGPVVWIDAAAEAETILEALGDTKLDTLVTTHRHHDHIGATAAIMSRTGAAGACGFPDEEAISSVTATSQRPVWDGDTIAVGPGELDVIGIMGHTPGSIVLAWRAEDGPAHLFTGDSLFPGGVGKTWSQEDFDNLLSDVEHKLFGTYGDDTVVHPGHGDGTTLGAERPDLPEWRSRGW